MVKLLTQTAARFANSASIGRHTRVGGWCGGVAHTTRQRDTFDAEWRLSNQRAIMQSGPAWVVLGDSTAQGLGAQSIQGGYVSQVHRGLVSTTGSPWRVINLSRSGATVNHVLHEQVPVVAHLGVIPELVTCGVGTNDLRATPPARLHAAIRALIAALPDSAIVLDLPLPTQWWGIVGQVFLSHVRNVNTTIYAAARERELPVAPVSKYFTPPWTGKFSADHFHPSETGYRDWAQAVLETVVATGGLDSVVE